MIVVDYDGVRLIGGKIEGAIIVQFDPEELDPELYDRIYSYLVGNFYTTPDRFNRGVLYVKTGRIAVAPSSYVAECDYVFKALGNQRIYDLELNLCHEMPDGYCECWDHKCMLIYRRTGNVRGGCKYLLKHLEKIPPEYRFNLFMCKHLVGAYIIATYGYGDFLKLSEILFERGVKE